MIYNPADLNMVQISLKVNKMDISCELGILLWARPTSYLGYLLSWNGQTVKIKKKILLISSETMCLDQSCQLLQITPLPQPYTSLFEQTED